MPQLDFLDVLISRDCLCLQGCEVILEDCTAGWTSAADYPDFQPRSNVYVVLESKKNPDWKWLAVRNDDVFCIKNEQLFIENEDFCI